MRTRSAVRLWLQVAKSSSDSVLAVRFRHEYPTHSHTISIDLQWFLLLFAVICTRRASEFRKRSPAKSCQMPGCKEVRPRPRRNVSLWLLLFPLAWLCALALCYAREKLEMPRRLMCWRLSHLGHLGDA